LVFGLGSFYMGDAINNLIDSIYNKTTFFIIIFIVLLIGFIIYRKKR
jgi:TM2 domain-containing membrane protein YozV